MAVTATAVVVVTRSGRRGATGHRAGQSQRALRKRHHITPQVTTIKPTVLIYNCTWVCDARCEMCNNWKWGNRKEDMTLEQLDRGGRALDHQ